jgi:hypothetical protein
MKLNGAFFSIVRKTHHLKAKIRPEAPLWFKCQRARGEVAQGRGVNGVSNLLN